MKRPYKIALFIITVLLCVTMLAALTLWVISAHCPAEVRHSVIAARDVFNAAIPLIGICIMLMLISSRTATAEKSKK